MIKFIFNVKIMSILIEKIYILILEQKPNSKKFIIVLFFSLYIKN